MTEPLSHSPTLSDGQAEVHPVQAALRFLRAVRYRKSVVIVAVTLAVLLGGLYYATTERIYESKAQVLVMQTGLENWSGDISSGRAAQDLMTTYRNMLGSEAVLEESVELLPAEHRVDMADRPRNRWVHVLQDNLQVDVIRNTNILKIGYRSKDPEAAAAVVNSVVSAYLEFMHTLHKSTAREILDILSQEKVSLEEKLRQKEAELLAKRRQAGDAVLRDGDQGINVITKRVVTLNEALIAAHEKRLAAQSRLLALETAVRNREDLLQHALAMIDAVGREVVLQQLGLGAADSQTVSRINQQVVEDRARLQSLLQVYGPAHHKVRETQDRIGVAEQFLHNRQSLENDQLRQLGNQKLAPLLLQMARQQLGQTSAHENAILQSYEQEKLAATNLDGTMTQLKMLELDLDRLRGFYDVVVQRVTDIDLGQESGALRMRVLSRPEVPGGPVWPKLPLVGMMALVLGLGGGLVIVYLQELLDDHFRSPEELQLHIGLPILTMVRRMEPVADCGIEAVHAHVRPNAVEVEAFRTLRTALALGEGGVQRLVVSSSEPGDGKTTIASNLATVYAQSGKRTLLIDADMRRPGLTPMLDLRGPLGLSAVLRSGGSVDEAARANLHVALAENLDVIAAGPRPTNPTELLASERFSELLAWAETHYDQIVIDSPPALVSDTAIIGRLVDGLLLAVQPEKNRRRVVLRAVESFVGLGINVLGVVVNRQAAEKDDDYYGYGYGYGYGGYGHYGHDDEDTDAGERAQRPYRVEIEHRAA